MPINTNPTLITMGCKPTKLKVNPKPRFVSSMNKISMNSQELLAQEIVRASAHEKFNRAKMKLKIINKLKK